MSNQDKFNVEVSITRHEDVKVGYLDFDPDYHDMRHSKALDELGLILDLSDDGKLVGIEFLDPSRIPNVKQGG